MLIDHRLPRLPGMSTLDLAFATQMSGGAVSSSVALAFAMLSQQVASGHVCLDLAACANMALGNGTSVPPLEDWLAALRSHPACGGANDYTPLVLEGERLYMRRHFDYECAVAVRWQKNVEAQLSKELSRELSRELQAALAQVFPIPTTGEDRQCDQRAAARHALTHRRALISGGPGTGKTTTLASILGLLLLQQPGLKILLAAPTGKAAARMQDAIRNARGRVSLAEEITSAIPDTAQTLHRLLGMRPFAGGAQWLHHAGNPLDCDVLVVDEASMIDLALMARLLDALPADARLILLGDRDQLASVEAGAVFADLCSAGAATLQQSFRFDRNSPIGQLATALRSGDQAAAKGVLATLDEACVWQREFTAATVVQQAAWHYARFVTMVGISQPIDALMHFDRFRLLTPLRAGSLGVSGLNSAVEAALVKQGVIPPRSHWYVGKPVMVTANDHAQKLFNGDIGVCVQDPASGELRIVFAGSADSEGAGVRLIAPARLPPHETAWAMTVHKSQGSEFDQVAIVLPDPPGELVTRELLYTAVTRARQSVCVWASEAALDAAIERRIVRHSGLTSRLALIESI